MKVTANLAALMSVVLVACTGVHATDGCISINNAPTLAELTGCDGVVRTSYIMVNTIIDVSASCRGGIAPGPSAVAHLNPVGHGATTSSVSESTGAA